MIVIAELIGVPPSDQESFKEWSTEVESSIRCGETPTASHGHGAGAELADYLATVLEERRREPRDDLLCALLAAEIDGQP